MKKILVVEDNHDLNDMLKIVFMSEGYQIKSAFTGAEALTLMSEFHPDLVFLDIMMPTMDGYQFLELLRTNGFKSSKVIVYSNLEHQKDIDRALNLGANMFLKKSKYTPVELVEKVKELLS